MNTAKMSKRNVQTLSLCIKTQLIEASRLGNEDLDIIGTMLRRNYIQCKDKGTEKTYQLDLSIDRFVQNMKDIPRLLA